MIRYAVISGSGFGAGWFYQWAAKGMLDVKAVMSRDVVDANTVLSVDGDTVDYICFVHYGETKGVVEKVLTANPGLAEYGAVLPAGVLVVLPEVAVSSVESSAVRLWS